MNVSPSCGKYNPHCSENREALKNPFILEPGQQSNIQTNHRYNTYEVFLEKWRRNFNPFCILWCLSQPAFLRPPNLVRLGIHLFPSTCPAQQKSNQWQTPSSHLFRPLCHSPPFQCTAPGQSSFAPLKLTQTARLESNWFLYLNSQDKIIPTLNSILKNNHHLYILSSIKGLSIECKSLHHHY